MTELPTAKIYQCWTTCKKISFQSWLRCTNLGPSKYCPSKSMQCQSMHRENPTESYVLLWNPGKTAVWLQVTTPTTTTNSKFCQMQQNIRQRNFSSPCLSALRRIIVCRWRVSENAVKGLALCFGRSVSAFSSFVYQYLDPVVRAAQCSQRAAVRGIAVIFTRHIGQPSCAFPLQDRNWKKNAILQSVNLNSLEWPYYQKEYHHKFKISKLPQ